MRIDKFLKISRILKRRAVANEACNGGKVEVNSKSVKPSYQVKEGDVVKLTFGNGSVCFKILCVKENVKKEEASSLYEIIQ